MGGSAFALPSGAGDLSRFERGGMSMIESGALQTVPEDEELSVSSDEFSMSGSSEDSLLRPGDLESGRRRMARARKRPGVAGLPPSFDVGHGSDGVNNDL